LRGDEFKITNLSFEVLCIDPDQGGVCPNERGRRDDETTSGEIFAQCRERGRRFVIEPQADEDQRKGAIEGPSVLSRKDWSLQQRFKACYS
jgi:hypothetical protein